MILIYLKKLTSYEVLDYASYSNLHIKFHVHTIMAPHLLLCFNCQVVSCFCDHTEQPLVGNSGTMWLISSGHIVLWCCSKYVSVHEHFREYWSFLVSLQPCGLPIVRLIICVCVFVYTYICLFKDGLFYILKLIAAGICISSTESFINTNFVRRKNNWDNLFLWRTPKITTLRLSCSLEHRMMDEV
jgi:hypothetical protein